MKNFPLKYPPGFKNNGPMSTSQGRWRIGNLMRFNQGRAMPIKGWRTRIDDLVDGVPRALISYSDLTSTGRIAIGTNTKLYEMVAGNVLVDITPVGFTPGSVNSSGNTGYGGWLYGSGTYGTPRPSLGNVPPMVWSLDKWGGNLVGCADGDGYLYEYDNDTNPAAVITNAPTDNYACFVTNERMLVALGADGDGTKVAWCDQEDNTDWTPSTINTAGDFNLVTSGNLKTGIRLRSTHLVFTEADVHTMNFVGSPFVYGFERAGDGCGVVSKGAAVAADDKAFWMGFGRFFAWVGYVQPLECEIADYVFSNITTDQLGKVTSSFDAQAGEVSWCYPKSEGGENDRRVRYNVTNDTWAMDEIARTAACDRGNEFPLPLALDPDGQLYEHEVGYGYDGGEAYIEGGPIQLGNAEQVLNVAGMIPDEDTYGRFSVEFLVRDRPAATETTKGPYSQDATRWDFRFSGRHIRPRFTGAALTDWRIGEPNLIVAAGGAR